MTEPPRPERAPDRPSRKAAPRDREADALRTCPRCGQQLAERKCKLICPDPICGYYLSCSDFY
jgi:hypothetical protein